MYDHARKHHWVYDQMHSGPCKVSVHLKQQFNTQTCGGDHLCACTEDCIMYVHARKRQFVHNRGQCACKEGCVVYVPALK